MGRRKINRFNFEFAVTLLLQSLGARRDDEAMYPFALDTVAGVLMLSPHEDWLATRFDDVAAAKRVVSSGQLNPFSGKWNFHFTDPGEAEVVYLAEQLRRIMGADQQSPQKASDALGQGGSPEMAND